MPLDREFLSPLERLANVVIGITIDCPNCQRFSLYVMIVADLCNVSQLFQCGIWIVTPCIPNSQVRI
jgi:hypothetical protein